MVAFTNCDKLGHMQYQHAHGTYNILAVDVPFYSYFTK